MRYLSDAVVYELRGAEVRVARRDYPCDVYGCALEGATIEKGADYAYVNTGLRFCSRHFTPDHIIEEAK
jgi:hypothetical protein